MNREECRVGMNVIFGNNSGEKTRGIVVKVNPTKAKVQTTENRGHRHGVGTVWSVPYPLLQMVDSNGAVVEKEIKYNPFAHVDNLILEAVLCCYGELSPENLSCDGEASYFHMANKKNSINKKLKGLLMAYGTDINEKQIYDWHDSKLQYERNK
jgi:hypothetical protein